MDSFNPYITNDASVGLYSKDYDDVYHSTYGALTEAYEKFILPANFNEYFKYNNEIKILDLCFGIGYNTKSFLNYLIENLNIGAIGSDNITNNDKIYTDNKKYKIFIHAVENDKNLVQISPFIKTDIKNINKNSLPFKHEKISKMLSVKTESKYELNTEINFLLLDKIKNLIDDDIKNILSDKKYSKYFNQSIIDYFRSNFNHGYKLYPLRCINAFLHNIYYKYISISHKRAIKALKMLDFKFDISINDARTVLKQDQNTYNFVFLDAFTPTKCPCLWTLDFFKLLYEHLEDNGMILTYSNSAQVRHAMLEAGFDIYKNMIDGKSQGTIAIKCSCPPLEGGPKSMISRRGNLRELSQYDLGLLKTKAGIFYRDENLNLTNDEIIARHEIEVKNSNLISASKYKRKNVL